MLFLGGVELAALHSSVGAVDGLDPQRDLLQQKKICWSCLLRRRSVLQYNSRDQSTPTVRTRPRCRPRG